ncbi:sucrase ferredoxin [Bacillus horti]|uniref:Sucrase ferredoxin n=1 Tax=Caldalkalibacillus horti TaxID=77523 RepID=A0ABT9VXA4_9BACI|nr:sucrase ferredoxin [Bacillus horti]MDQ0165622.1 hypothetical protein [Bacillus horti]
MADTRNEQYDQISGEVEKNYCSLISRQSNEDPIGSASSHERYVFVEVPTPWEYKVEESKHYPQGLVEAWSSAVKKEGTGQKPPRLLSITSDRIQAPAGFRRIIYYSRTTFPLAYFEKREYLVLEEQVIELILSLLNQNNEKLHQFEANQVTEEYRDLFICTHGSHDRCCGKFGYPMYQEIDEKYASNPSLSLRAWRTSHFGGHRHAPTIIDLPEGRYWAQLRPDLLPALIERKGEATQLARHYRGWGAITAFEQVAEREIFMKEGWSWIGYQKQSTILEADEMKATIRIDYSTTDQATSGAYEAEIQIGDTVTVGGCGLESFEARQFVVKSLVKV